MNDERTLYDRLGGHEGILKLIQSFYVDARQHAVLGPIFNSQIKDWPTHLAKITEFWALQTGGPSLYRGGFAAAHLRIPVGLESAHFQDWVGLWELNNGRHLPPQEAAEMNALAHEFARRLFGIVSGAGRRG